MKKKVLIPLCIVGAVAMLAGGFFGMMFLQKHLDKRAYEKTDTKLESIFEDSDFIAMDVDERKKKMDSVLEDLQDDGQISDIKFDETEKMYGFTYKSGVLGCIALKEYDDQTFSGGYTCSQAIVDAPLSNVNAQKGFDSLTSDGEVKVQLCFSMQDECKVFFDDMDADWPENSSKYYKDYDYTLEKLKKLKNRDVYILAFHGSDFFGKKALTVDADGGRFKYWKDLIRLNVVRYYGDGGKNGKGSYLVFPSFFKRNYSKGSLKGSTVISEACMFYGCDCNDKDIVTSFADVFVDYLGADAVLGFRNSVNGQYATDITRYVIGDMLNKGSTVNSALANATKKYGKNDNIEDLSDDKYKAYPILTGNKKNKLIDGADDKVETESTEAATGEAYTSDNSTDDPEREYAEKVYGEVIDAYLVKRDTCVNDEGVFEGNIEFDYPYGDDTSGGYNYFLMIDGFSNAGYTITDLDGDGTYEMIFAELGSTQVYDVFTLVNGEPKMVLDSWMRCSLFYCGDYFYTAKSGGASYHFVDKWKIDGGLKRLDSVFTDLSDRTGELEYYYMDYNRPNSDPDGTTKDSYDKFISYCEADRREVPNLIPFQEYIEKRSADSADNSTEGKKKYASSRGNVWYLPFDFSSVDQTAANGDIYMYEDEKLDMTVKIWEAGLGALPYVAASPFLDDMYEQSKIGNVTYSDRSSIGGYCVNSGYLDSGRIYYDKYMVLGEGADVVLEVYFEYGQEHKDECDKVVTEFWNDCELIKY